MYYLLLLLSPKKSFFLLNFDDFFFVYYFRLKVGCRWCWCCSQHTFPTQNLTKNFLDLIVEDQHKSASSTTEYVGQSTLEESASTFVLGDLAPAVQGVLVHNVGLCATRLHHHASSDSVEWIGQDSREDGDGLKN